MSPSLLQWTIQQTGGAANRDAPRLINYCLHRRRRGSVGRVWIALTTPEGPPR